MWGIVTLICGIIVLIGSGRLTELAWTIVVIIVGLVGGGVGGVLAFLGGIIALIATYV